jgi:hypothetical protein
MIIIIIVIVVVYLLFIKSPYTAAPVLTPIQPAALGKPENSVAAVKTQSTRSLTTTFGPERMCAVVDYMNKYGLTLGYVDTFTGYKLDNDAVGPGWYPTLMNDADQNSVYDALCSDYYYPYAVSVCDVYDVFGGLCNGTTLNKSIYNVFSSNGNTALGDDTKLCAAGTGASGFSKTLGLFSDATGDADLFQTYCYQFTGA